MQVIHSIVSLTHSLTDCHRDALGVSLSRELKNKESRQKESEYLLTEYCHSPFVCGITDVIVYHKEGRKGGESVS